MLHSLFPSSEYISVTFHGENNSVSSTSFFSSIITTTNTKIKIFFSPFINFTHHTHHHPHQNGVNATEPS